MWIVFWLKSIQIAFGTISKLLIKNWLLHGTKWSKWTLLNDIIEPIWEPKLLIYWKIAIGYMFPLVNWKQRLLNWKKIWSWKGSQPRILSLAAGGTAGLAAWIQPQPSILHSMASLVRENQPASLQPVSVSWLWLAGWLSGGMIFFVLYYVDFFHFWLTHIWGVF